MASYFCQFSSIAAVVYIFETKNSQESSGKFFIRLNFEKDGEVSNSVRSGGIVELRNFRDTNQYEVIDGEI